MPGYILTGAPGAGKTAVLRLGFATPRLLAQEVDCLLAEGAYERTAFFICNQGFIQATATSRDRGVRPPRRPRRPPARVH